MSKYQQSEDVLIVSGLEALIISLGRGSSRIDAFKAIGNTEYGQISKICKRLGDELGKQESYVSVLSREALNQHNLHLRRFLTIMNSDESVDVTASLAELSDQIIKQAMNSSSDIVNSWNNLSQRLFITLALPIFIFISIIVTDALKGIYDLSLRPMLDYVVYGVTASIIILITLSLRRKL